MARLALLNLHTGDLAAGHRWATQALAIHSEVDSARLRRALTEVRKATENHHDEATMSELAAAIATAIAAAEPPATDPGAGHAGLPGGTGAVPAPPGNSDQPASDEADLD